MLCYSKQKPLSLQRGDVLYYYKHAVSAYEVLFGVPYGTNKHCLERSPQSLLPLRRNALKIRQKGQSLSTANTHKHTQTHTLLGGCFYFHFLCLCGKKNVSASWWDFHRSAGSMNSNLAIRNIKNFFPHILVWQYISFFHNLFIFLQTGSHQ
jgi:hypothetical protein